MNIKLLREKLQLFDVYHPQYKVNMRANISDEKQKEIITDEVQQHVMSNIDKLDTDFALKNYNYVTKRMNNPKLAEIYDLLGPFNYSLNKETYPQEFTTDDIMRFREQEMNEVDFAHAFEKRRSGA